MLARTFFDELNIADVPRSCEAARTAR